MGTTGRGSLRPWDPIFLRKTRKGALNAVAGNTPPTPAPIDTWDGGTASTVGADTWDGGSASTVGTDIWDGGSA